MSELFSLSVTADDATHHSLTSLASAAIAQLGERQTEDLKVPGSIPGLGMPAGAYAVWSPSGGDKGMGGFGGGISQMGCPFHFVRLRIHSFPRRPTSVKVTFAQGRNAQSKTSH